MGCRAFALLPVPPCVVACGAAGVPGVGPGLCVCRWCSGPRARPLCVPVGGGPPASRPRCELRSARRLEARPGPATAHRHGGRSLRHPTHRLRLACWRVAQRVGSLSGRAPPWLSLLLRGIALHRRAMHCLVASALLHYLVHRFAVVKPVAPLRPCVSAVLKPVRPLRRENGGFTGVKGSQW